MATWEVRLGSKGKLPKVRNSSPQEAQDSSIVFFLPNDRELDKRWLYNRRFEESANMKHIIKRTAVSNPGELLSRLNGHHGCLLVIGSISS